MKDYDRAVEYSQSALTTGNATDAEIKQIHLYLLNTYRKQNNIEEIKRYGYRQLRRQICEKLKPYPL